VPWHHSRVIRQAANDDAAAIAAIYNEGIEDRQATFETGVRDASYFGDALSDRERPFLVAEREGRVLGFARALVYNWREAYRGVGEASIYVAREARGRGLGAELLTALVDEAQRRGYWKLIGLIFPENEASVALFRNAGWREVGVYLRHGRLDGEWRDVLLLELLMGPARSS
jgi:phosphinothricin acetyltransferase